MLLSFRIYNIFQQFQNPDFIKGFLTGFAIMLLISLFFVIFPINRFIEDYRKRNEMYHQKMYGHVKDEQIKKE